MKILVVNARFPFPPTGADEADRARGMSILTELGHEVRVLTKFASYQKPEIVPETERALGISVRTVLYTKGGFTWRRLANPIWLDGAAFEYAEPMIQQALHEELDTFCPDIVWFDHSFLWPLYKEVRRRKIPIITRSINVESYHFLQEDGISVGNLIKFCAKMCTEYIVSKRSDHLFSITPKEEKTYRWLGARSVSTLPLRGLIDVAPREHLTEDRAPVNVIFMGSTYSVHHNLEAARMVITEIAPGVEKRAPGKFVFNIAGAKLPPELITRCIGPVQYVGYITPKDFLPKMDISLTPSLFGAGMQQKIFEPLLQGIPVITSERGIAEYPFVSGTHYLAAHTAEEYIAQILSLEPAEKRRAIGTAARTRALTLFDRTHIVGEIKRVLDVVTASSRRG